MTDLRPCPFCGSDACYVDEDGSALLEPTLDASCGSTRCMPPSSYVPASSWQARPIEDALLARAEAAEDKLHRINQWCRAYPLDIFPEPDLKRVRELLEAGGITIDCVTAYISRRVLNGITKIVKER